MNDAHYKLLKTFTNHKTFHPGVDSKTNKKTSRGKEKYLQFFFLKTLSLIILSFNFLSTQKILAIYACLKRKEHFCICIKISK